MTERGTRDDDGRPSCCSCASHNAGRSQMALGWFNHLAGDRAIAWSGGSEPADRGQPGRGRRHGRGRHRHHHRVPEAVDRRDRPRRRRRRHDGLRRHVPLLPGTRYEDWELDDPAGLDIDAVRPIRDEIEQRVRELLDQITAPSG